MAPKLSTIVGYLIALIPAYIFVLAPVSRLIFGTDSDASQNEVLDTSKIDPKLLSLISPDEVLNCSSPPYNVHIFSRAPLVIYIESFLSDDEASHLVRER
jgi:prolyl 4-hydroxylase